jgi:hypothetical protein
MTTIVEYTDAKAPRNLYPRRIISPSHSKPCCFSEMEEIGGVQQDGQWEYRYKRCRTCGFAVRVILRALPDEALLRDLRRTLENSFKRNVPDL